jgi:hypothetical protein
LSEEIQETSTSSSIPETGRAGTPNNGPSGFDLLDAWKEYERVAMHFNDLLIRFRSQSLAAVAAFATIAGVWC